jgi:hypothetical protein
VRKEGQRGVPRRDTRGALLSKGVHPKDIPNSLVDIQPVSNLLDNKAGNP